MQNAFTGLLYVLWTIFLSVAHLPNFKVREKLRTVGLLVFYLTKSTISHITSLLHRFHASTYHFWVPQVILRHPNYWKSFLVSTRATSTSTSSWSWRKRQLQLQRFIKNAFTGVYSTLVAVLVYVEHLLKFKVREKLRTVVFLFFYLTKSKLQLQLR